MEPAAKPLSRAGASVGELVSSLDHGTVALGLQLQPVCRPAGVSLSSGGATAPSSVRRATMLGSRGATLVDEVVSCQDVYRLCYLCGPEEIVIGIAQQLGQSILQEASRRRSALQTEMSFLRGRAVWPGFSVSCFVLRTDPMNVPVARRQPRKTGKLHHCCAARSRKCSISNRAAGEVLFSLRAMTTNCR